MTWNRFPRMPAASSPACLQSGCPAEIYLASFVYGCGIIYRLAGDIHGGRLWGPCSSFISDDGPESLTGNTTARSNTLAVLKSHWRLGIYAVLLMTAFNFFSHGTQDLLSDIPASPARLLSARGRPDRGYLQYRRHHRRYLIRLDVGALRPAAHRHYSPPRSRLPSFLFGRFATAVWLAIGAFFMQIMVQGAWGVVPVHLNELSPDDARGTFPGFVYQLGNLIASVNAPLQAAIESHYGGDYAFALALVAGVVAVVIAVLTALGTEARGISFRRGADRPIAREHFGLIPASPEEECR